MEQLLLDKIKQFFLLNDYQYPWEDWKKVEKRLFTIIKIVVRIKVNLILYVFEFLSIWVYLIGKIFKNVKIENIELLLL